MILLHMNDKQSILAASRGKEQILRGNLIECIEGESPYFHSA